MLVDVEWMLNKRYEQSDELVMGYKMAPNKGSDLKICIKQ